MPVETTTTAQPDINQVLRINELNLTSEMSNCAAWFYYYAALSIDAEDSADAATLAIETYEQQLAAEYKSQPAVYGEKLAQPAIQRLFRADARWQALKEQESKLKVNAKILDKAAKAIEMKSRMLMSINKRDMYKKGIMPTSEDN